MNRTLGLSLALSMALLSRVSFIPRVHADETVAVKAETGAAKLQIELRLKPNTGRDGKLEPITREALDRAVQIFWKRAKAGGIAEPRVQVKMPDCVVVQL